MEYPRMPGSDKVVRESEWKQGGPVGICPACGSKGIEELSCPGSEDICFYCSDPTCKTIQDGRTIPERTKWNSDKPKDMQQKEKELGWSWNQEHWPGQDLPMACPD